MAVGTEEKTNGPGKRVIALAILVVAIISTVLITRGSKEASSVGITTQETPERVVVTEKDTDGDGLKDWEEALYGTNPNLTDTDGDGISDSEEKLADEERTLEEQQQLLADITSLADSEDPEFKSLPYTDQVSRSLLTQYLALKQSGTPITGSALFSLIQNIPEYQAPPLTVPVYTENDIFISQSSDTTALRTYGNNLGSLLVVPDGENPESELLVLLTFIQTREQGVLGDGLADVIQRYTNVLNGMKNISVPKTLSQKHLTLMNALAKVRSDLELFKNLDEDPFLALSAVQNYNKDSTARATAFASIYSYLTEQGITYDESEPGFRLSGQ